MAEKRRLMSWPEYLAWEAVQPTKHELVDGEVRAMSSTRARETVRNNLREELRERLRGNPCRPQGADLKIRTGTGNVRHPAALIDCGKQELGRLVAIAPVIVFDVLSRGTTWIEQEGRFDDYDETPTIRHYVLIFENQMRVMAYGRDDQGQLDRRRATVLRDPGESLSIPNLELSLPLAALYEDVELEERT